MYFFFVGWLQQLESKVKNFLGDVEPVNLGWLYDPLRYLSAVNIRHLISSNLGSASTEFLITLSGIKDIHELKEGLHSGCYTNGNYILFVLFVLTFWFCRGTPNEWYPSKYYQKFNFAK